MKNKKTTKILEMILLILIIALVTLVSFFGLLYRDLNLWKNVVPDYSFGKDLGKMRILSFSVDTSTEPVEENTSSSEDEVEVNQTVSEDEEISKDASDENATEESTPEEVPVNPNEVLTADNYKKVKSIIQKRLDKADIKDTEIVVDEKNGDLTIYVPFDGDSDAIVEHVTSKGTIEITDTETSEVLIPQEMISKVATYATVSQDQDETVSGSTYDIGLQINFTKEGLDKLASITRKYVDVLNSDGESDPKTVDIKVDGQTAYTTYFDPAGTYTELDIPMYSGVEEDQYELYIDAMKSTETNIESGKLPITYVTNQVEYLENRDNSNILLVIIVAICIAIAVVSICLIVKNKFKGLVEVISQIGFIALYLLLVRVVGESLTIFSIISMFILAMINYLFIIKLFNSDKKTFIEVLEEFTLKYIPVLIVAVVFAFSSYIELASIGTALVWGIVASIPYNLIFTNNLLKIYKELNKMGGRK